jgi:hypothetical protein
MLSSARNIRIELAALAKLSFASGILFELISRPSDPQNGFHTAKTQCGHAAPEPLMPLQYIQLAAFA